MPWINAQLDNQVSPERPTRVRFADGLTRTAPEISDEDLVITGWVYFEEPEILPPPAPPDSWRIS